MAVKGISIVGRIVGIVGECMERMRLALTNEYLIHPREKHAMERKRSRRRIKIDIKIRIRIRTRRRTSYQTALSFNSPIHQLQLQRKVIDLYHTKHC